MRPYLIDALALIVFSPRLAIARGGVGTLNPKVDMIDSCSPEIPLQICPLSHSLNQNYFVVIEQGYYSRRLLFKPYQRDEVLE